MFLNNIKKFGQSNKKKKKYTYKYERFKTIYFRRKKTC